MWSIREICKNSHILIVLVIETKSNAVLGSDIFWGIPQNPKSPQKIIQNSHKNKNALNLPPICCSPQNKDSRIHTDSWVMGEAICINFPDNFG